jgi:hypothetical protein
MLVCKCLQTGIGVRSPSVSNQSCNPEFTSIPRVDEQRLVTVPRSGYWQNLQSILFVAAKTLRVAPNVHSFICKIAVTRNQVQPTGKSCSGRWWDAALG